MASIQTHRLAHIERRHIISILANDPADFRKRKIMYANAELRDHIAAQLNATCGPMFGQHGGAWAVMSVDLKSKAWHLSAIILAAAEAAVHTGAANAIDGLNNGFSARRLEGEAA